MSPFKPSYGGELLAGVDEVGRGPLAGDVVAAAVILDPRKRIRGLRDSKILTEARREQLYDEICTKALSWCVARASVAEIDRINILQASLLAMTRAVQGLDAEPEHVLVDGNHLPVWSFSAEAVIKGDSRHPAISAASILAKVTRDREMALLDKEYPGYGFAENKGYPTKSHLAALTTLGVTPVHRTSYGPVRERLAQIELF
ncbi:ribonuclease HII [Marinimicrobium sp. ABcell2]|uniref:ribonuclease HII n=1 Tax=Marinimicrobium sp. ABcell2 TaxID=3069751 RepID=UPI0027B326EB|nr:ribonuclease HII [Marinimicrobium sp. ABcell2]MDQ2075338.1 ribonuclease HII [Marinimicrobium sp. ABcell2]